MSDELKDQDTPSYNSKQHLWNTSEPPVEPVTTEPEPDMASGDEETTTTTVFTPGQSSIAQEPHPDVVTFREPCRRSQLVRKSPAFLKDYVCD